MLESHLMQVDEAPELFADAVLVDAADNLLFLSLWGRDTALQEFLARLSLPVHEGGLDSFFLCPGNSENGLSEYKLPRRKLVQIGDADRLDHYSGRMPTNIFGDMAHLWLFNRLVTEPDLANRRTIALFKPDEVSTEAGREAVHSRIWQLTKAICHLPLLDHWINPVTEAFRSRDWIKDFDGIGIHAAMIDLNLGEEVETVITGLVRDGSLTLA